MVPARVASPFSRDQQPFGIPALNTCACCGQNLKLDGRPVVKVDDALLALCNEAYANAELRGSGEVLIADLAWCVARSPRWSVDIETAGLSPERMERAAQLAIARCPLRGRSTGSVATSGDLKTLLRRAERRALDGGRAAAETRDFLHVLLREAGDLSGADFLREDLAVTGRVNAGAHLWRTSSEQPRPHSYRTSAERDLLGTPSHAYAPSRDVAVPSKADADIALLAGRLAAQERQNVELHRRNEALADQMQSLSARLARMTERSGMETGIRSELSGLMSRLEAQDRQIAELQRLVEALAHQSATAVARLSQASELGRAQSEALAELERRLREGATHRSERTVRRRRPGSARSRLRRSRRQSLRLRLRQRRRDRMRSERARDRRRLWRERGATWGSAQTTRADRAKAEAHAAPPLAVHPEHETERFEAFPRAYIESAPPGLLRDAAPLLEYDEDIAEPIEDEDEFEPDGALGERPKRFYLALDDEVERAPSIGPRTAARLTAAGVATVRDLLACNPRDIASRVQSRYVSAERVAAWKSQARLVCTVPWLRGTHAQLLVGAGYDTLDKLQQVSTSDVCAGILRFSATREGQSVLRSGPPPAPERIATWMGHVTLAEPERARLVA